MKTKKFVIAMAIFGGVLFISQADNSLNLDAEQTTFIKKGPRPIIAAIKKGPRPIIAAIKKGPRPIIA